MLVLVTGAYGQLGQDVIAELDARDIPCVGIDRDEYDIADLAQVREAFETFHPTAVIHCAAYTAVDQAEIMREDCYAANVTGSRNMARMSKEFGASILGISTDYVFDGEGDQFFEVDDPTGPKNYYGETKLLGEKAIQEETDQFFIVRTSWVFGENGKNFVKTMRKFGEERGELRVVKDEVGSPTYTKDLAKLLADMIVTDKYGVYHATNEGICNRCEFAEAIMERFGIRCNIIPVTHEEYPTPAVRPHNSRLSKDSLERAGFNRLPDWKDALRRFCS